MPYPRILLLAIFFLVSQVPFICSLTLELYSGRDYSYFLKKVIVEQDEEKKCNFPGDYFTIKSIKTDKCVMLYQNPQCLQRPDGFFPNPFYSYRVENDTAHFDIRKDLYKENFFGDEQKDERVFTSFHVCSDELGGGGKVNVDMYPQPQYWGSILQSWKGVCKCENIPDWMYNKTYSINNQGNSLYIFTKENCRGEPMLIPAGDSEASRDIAAPKEMDVIDIRSFRPAGALDCLKLNASIYKFTLFNGWRSGEPQQNNVQMAPTKTLTNFGSLPINQTIEFSKTVLYTIEYSVADAFRQMDSVGVATDFETDSNTGIQFIELEEIHYSLKANYQYTRNQQEPKWNKTSVTEMERANVNTTVEVAACQTCNVTGYINVVRDSPINYTAAAVVKGMAWENQLAADEIRDYLPKGMEYIRDHDEHSVVVSVEGSMPAEFAWKTFVTKDCEPVPKCGDHQNEARVKTHEIYDDVGFVLEDNQESNPFCGKYEFPMSISNTCDAREFSDL